MVRRTPLIKEQNQSYSAIAHELVFSDGNNGTVSFIPKEAAKDHITLENGVITQNGEHTPQDADFFDLVKVQVSQNALARFKLTEGGGYFNVPGETTFDGVKRVIVDVQYGDDLPVLEARKNGVYTGVFKEVHTEVHEELPDNPHPERIKPSLNVTENGSYDISSEGDYDGWGRVNVNIEKVNTISPRLSTFSVPLYHYVASCRADDSTHIFSGFEWIIKSTNLESVTSMPFSASGLSAFYVDGKIHLVGNQSNANVHKVWDGESWSDGSTSGLPTKFVSPTIIQAEGKVLSFGAGDSSMALIDAARYIYSYDAENDVWEQEAAISPLIMTLYNHDHVTYWKGKVHVWKGRHMSYDISTKQWNIEEQTYSDLFKNTFDPLGSTSHYRLASNPTKTFMINARHSTAYATSITSCEYKNGEYVYKFEGWLPYAWLKGIDELGPGQSVLKINPNNLNFFVFGSPGDSCDKWCNCMAAVVK